MMHKSITPNSLRTAMLLNKDYGFCIFCGAGRDGCNEAIEYHCNNCGMDMVYRAEELLREMVHEALWNEIK